MPPSKPIDAPDPSPRLHASTQPQQSFYPLSTPTRPPRTFPPLFQLPLETLHRIAELTADPIAVAHLPRACRAGREAVMVSVELCRRVWRRMPGANVAAPKWGSRVCLGRRRGTKRTLAAAPSRSPNDPIPWTYLGWMWMAAWLLEFSKDPVAMFPRRFCPCSAGVEHAGPVRLDDPARPCAYHEQMVGLALEECIKRWEATASQSARSGSPSSFDQLTNLLDLVACTDHPALLRRVLQLMLAHGNVAQHVRRPDEPFTMAVRNACSLHLTKPVETLMTTLPVAVARPLPGAVYGFLRVSLPRNVKQALLAASQVDMAWLYRAAWLNEDTEMKELVMGHEGLVVSELAMRLDVQMMSPEELNTVHAKWRFDPVAFFQARELCYRIPSYPSSSCVSLYPEDDVKLLRICTWTHPYITPFLFPRACRRRNLPGALKLMAHPAFDLATGPWWGIKSMLNEPEGLGAPEKAKKAKVVFGVLLHPQVKLSERQVLELLDEAKRSNNGLLRKLLNLKSINPIFRGLAANSNTDQGGYEHGLELCMVHESVGVSRFLLVQLRMLVICTIVAVPICMSVWAATSVLDAYEAAPEMHITPTPFLAVLMAEILFEFRALIGHFKIPDKLTILLTGNIILHVVAGYVWAVMVGRLNLDSPEAQKDFIGATPTPKQKYTFQFFLQDAIMALVSNFGYGIPRYCIPAAMLAVKVQGHNIITAAITSLLLIIIENIAFVFIIYWMDRYKEAYHDNKDSQQLVENGLLGHMLILKVPFSTIKIYQFRHMATRIRSAVLFGDVFFLKAEDTDENCGTYPAFIQHGRTHDGLPTASSDAANGRPGADNIGRTVTTASTAHGFPCAA
ncbi:hypothetical protein HDU96_010222 [Phlyctochytrium bullatum]|nr:hypothetical protein HDU96_010222 [Phlyctochytrium bullatum]